MLYTPSIHRSSHDVVDIGAYSIRVDEANDTAGFLLTSSPSPVTAYRERKCAGTIIGTVLVPRADYSTMLKYKYIFEIKCTEAILSINSTRELLC